MQRRLTPMRSLATARLELTPQVAAHAADMFALLQDPAIYRYENEPPASVEQLHARFARLETRASADGSEAWLNWVVRLPGASLIGYVQATVHADASADIAYVFGGAFWGSGYARESVRAMMREIADGHGVTVFRAVFKRANARSRHLLERIGFVDGDASPAGIDDDEQSMVLGINAPRAAS